TAEVLQSSWKRDCFRKQAHVLRDRYGVWTTYDTMYLKKSALAVEIDLTWSRGVCLYRAGQASKPSFLQDLAHLSDLYFQADSAINLVTDSSKLGLQSGYEEFPLFSWYNLGPTALYCPPEIVELGLDSSKPVRSFSTSGSRLCSIMPFLGVFSHLLDGYLNISGSFRRTSQVVIEPDGWFLSHLLAALVRDTGKA
ncbi:hypothetical protein Tco_1115166, partial [Tanacetum coccineum]